MAYKDWLKEYRESQGTKTSTTEPSSSPQKTTSSSAGSGSFRDALNAYRDSQATISLQGWSESSINLINDIQNNSGKWHDENEYKSRFDKISSLLAKADDWRKQYSGNTEAISYIDSVVSALNTAKSYSFSSNRYFSQWESEDAYIKGATENREARHKRYEANKKRIEELKAQGKSKENKAEIEALEAQNAQYERGEGGYISKTVDDYYKVTQKSDFSAGSQNRVYKNPTQEEIAKADAMNDSSTWRFDANGVYRDAFGNELAVDDTSTWYNPMAQNTKVEDKLALYLNTPEDERVQAGIDTLGKDGIWSSVMKEGYGGGWEYLTEQEVGIYYYLLDENPESAFKYLSDMETELNRRRTREQTGKWYDSYDEANLLEKIALNIATVPSQFVSSLAGSIDNAINTLQGNEINPYSIAHGGMHFSQTVRGATAEDMDATGFKIPGLDYSLGDIYQVGMSRLDSALATGLTGGAGTLILGMGAAQNEAYRLYQAGATPEQATLGALTAGAAEAVFEYVSFDKLVKLGDAKTIGKWVKNALIQGGIEASEEFFTEISNIITNAVIMGSQSDLNKLYEDNGNDWLKTGLSLVQQTAQAAFGGFLGGFGAGATQGGNTYINTQAQYAETGRTITGADGGVDALKTLANKVAGVSDTKMQKTLNRQTASVDKKVTDRKVGRLYDTVQTANNLANAEANQADIAKSLQRKGFNADTAKDIASALVAQYNGQTLTRAQEKLLKSVNDSKVVKDAISNIMTNAQSTMGQRSQNIRGFQNDIARGVAYKAITETIRKNTTAEQFTPAGEYEVSDKGKAINTETDEEIEIKGVADIGRGKLILELADGTTIDAKSVSFASESDALIYEAIANLGDNINYETANRLIAKYDGSNAAGFARGIAQAYTYGFYGLDSSEMSLATELTKEQRNFAYGLGEQYRSVKDQADKGKARALKAPGEKGVYYRDKNGIATDIRSYLKQDGRVLNEMQTTGIEFMEKMSQMMGVRFNVFEGWEENGTRYYLDENGEKTEGSPNGFYDPKTGEIYIDLFAGNDFQGTMLFTVAHELTHFMRQWSPEHFTKIAKLVFSHAGFKGSVSSLVADKMNSKRRPNYDTALEEVVADGMETILKDGKVAEFMVDVKKTDSKLWAKLKEWFKNFADFLKKMVDAYSGQSAQTVEGQKVADFSKKLLTQIEQIWAEGAVSAGENYQAALENVVEANAEAVSSDEIITDGAVVTDGEGTKFSIKSMKHDIAEGQMFEDLKTHCGWTQKQVNELRQNLKDLVEYMTPHRDILDMNETYGREGRRFSPYKPNSDPLYKISMDFSTLCSKRLLTQYVIENLQLRENRPMSAEEQMAIRDMLNEYRKVEKGLQVACAMCYVEAARLKSPKQMQRWLDDPAPLLRDYFGKKNKEFNDSVKEAQADFKESRGYDRNAPKKDMKPADVKELNKIGPKMRSKYQLSAEEQAIIDKAKTLPNSTYLTAGNLSDLSETDPVIYDAYTAFVRTATRSKSLETDEPYYYGDSRRDNGNGIIVSDSFIEAVNRENGMRFSSWSDWRIQHLLDYITAVIDNSVRGAAMHGYTKFGEEVRVLGKTGMMFNMSGVAGTQTGLNEDGSLNFSPTESIDVNEAIQLREEFPETAGLQCIGVSDAHIIALLRSDIIDYIIPYHVSGLNAALRRMADIYGWDDYTGTQHAVIDKSIKKENAVDPEHWHDEPVFSEFFVGYDTGMSGIEAMRASAERYKQMCKDRGLTPKFNQFANEANYWKLLIDRKMINQQTGDLIRQKAVTPTFDFNTIKEVVDRYVDNYDSGLEARALNHIVENWDSIPKRIKDLKKQGGTKAKKTKKAVDTLANQTLAAQPNDGAKYSYRGKNKDGIEVYETSDKIKKLPYTDRQQQFLDIMENEYRGRTAKFIRNGHAYYATFEQSDVNKNIYGDNRSDKKGWKAKINVGAEGNIFELVENAQYDGSKPEKGKKIASHRGVGYWDYFIKNVQIDGAVFDLVANVRKKADGAFVYSIQLNENKKIKASPPLGSLLRASSGVPNASGTKVAQPAQKVNNNNSAPHSDRVTDQDTLDFLNEQLRNGEVTEVYRAMAVDDEGNLYPPMAGFVRKNGKRVINGQPSIIGEWEQSTESIPWESVDEEFLIGEGFKQYNPTKEYPNGRFERENTIFYRNKDGEWKAQFHLDKDNGETLHAAYAPYIHTSLSVLNDQFTSAYKRDNLVVVRGYVPNSEVNGVNGKRHHASFADKPVGKTKWHSGVVAAQMPETRTVILSRYFMPIEIVEDAEFAQKTKDMMKGKDIEIPFNVVTPRQRRALEAIGVRIGEARGLKDAPKKADVKYSDRNNAPTFYSQMAKVVDAVKQEKLGAASVVSMLRGKGVKAEEIKWSGIEEWLAGKKSVTKAELQEFIAGSMLQINETILDGNQGEPVKLPDNYRLEETANDSGDPILNLYIDDELVDTFEQVFDGSISSTGDSEIWAMNEEDLTGQILSHYAGMSYDEAYGNGTKETKWDEYKLNGGRNYRELIFKMPGTSHSNRAMEAHWGDRGFGVLAHARIQDFNTFIGKMLFIEEIQSDWHNEGHTKGYESAEYKEAERVSDELFNEWQKVRKPFHQYVRSSEFNTDPEDVRKKKFDWLRSKVETAEKKWQEAERYVESLRQKGAGTVPDAPFKDNYHEFVLKRLLRMAAEEGYDSIGWTTADIQSERWSEAYAEGYRIEYDQDIPKFLNKYGKKWGTKVGKTTLDNGTEVWSMAITDSMMESVLTEGQPLYSDRILMGSLFSGGGTLEAGLVYQMLDKEFAVEYNKQIAATYTDNHGKEHMFVGDVRDFNSKDKQNVFYLHASPVCKNFSPASHSGGETTIDIVTAQATARVLEEQMPQAFTVENVKRYIGSEAYNIITDKLTELGYKWDVDVYKASDYGNATKRDRMIIRAVKEGQLPAKPAKAPSITSWGDATRDLWETDLIPSTLVKSKIEAIRNTPKLKNLRLTQLDKPLMIYDTSKSKQAIYAWADELAPTLTTKCGDARIIMPDGKVYAPTPKFMGRIQGLPDDYKYPKAKTNAFKIIGNGIPTQLTKAVVGGVLDSAYEQTHDGQVLYQDRADNSVSNRSLLANAFEGIAKPEELPKIQEYKAKIALIEEEEKNLREINAQIKELSFAKGPRDNKRIKALRFDAVQAANRINTYDKQLLRLEASEPLQKVLNREKKLAYKKAEQRGKEALADYKAKVEAKQKETTEKWRESRKTAVAKARETAEKRDARAKLQKLVLDTVKWISYPAKTDVKCPDILKKPYEAFLQGIDLSSKRLANGGEATNNDLRLANAMDSLATAIDRVMLSQDPSQEVDKVLDIGYLDLPADFVQKLRDMTESIKSMMVEGEYVVNTMTADEVRKLSQMIRTLNHAIKTMSNLYANLRFANVEALGFDTMDFLDAVGEIEKTGGMKDFVEWDNALPYYAFKRFGKGGESVFEGLMDAQDKLAFLAKDIFAFQEKTWTGEEANAWSEDTHTITLPNGNELTLTTADAMSIYCLSRREHALPHLLGGGVRVMGIQKGSQKAKDSRSLLTIEDVSAIISSLTDRQRQVAEGIQEFMSTVCSDWGNEISMKRFLTREFTEKFYFPIESNDENLTVKDPAAQQSDLFRLLNISATKPLTQGANNEVIIRNIFDVFVGHTSDMARLNAYGMGLLDYMKWLNYREKSTNEEGQIKVRGVRKSMEQAYGKAANSYVINLIKDVNGRASDGGDPTILMKWMRAAKTASVGASLRVATLQITSYPRAALVLSPKSLSLGLTKKPNIDRAKKYCGIALWKSFGFYDTNISRSIEDQMKGVTDVKQKLIELSLKGAELGDAITWGALWNACEYEVAQTTTNKVGSEEFYQEVGKKLREVVYRTQVVDSNLTRSQIMRSKRGMAQEAAAFMSEPTLSANILMDAGFEFGLEKRRTGSAKSAWKKTSSYIGRAVAVYAIGQLTAALMEALWDAWRDDEDEEFGKKYLDAFIENLALDLVPFNKLPIVSDVFEAALALFGVGFYSSDKMSTTWLTQAVSAVDAWKKVLSGESSTTVYNALYKSTRAVSSMLGISISGAMREGVALWNNTAGAYDSTLKIRQYDLANADLGVELYEAIMSGNTRQADSLKAQFDDVGAMHSAIRKALRENDPRIKEAASADYIDKNPSERVRIARLIIADGFDQDDVVMAINSEIAEMKPDEGSSDPKAKGLYTADNFAMEIANGDQASAYEAKADIIATEQKNGKSEEDAVKKFNSSAKTALGKLFKTGELTEQEVITALVTFCDMEEDDAKKYAGGVAYEVEHPELDGVVTYTQYQRWEADGKPYGVSIDMFIDVAGFRDDGTSNSVKSQDEVALYISSVTSNRSLRHALWCCFYKASTSPWK